MIADMINNDKLNPIVTELFIRGRKLNISIVFITQSYFKVPKDVRLNSTHFFVMKIPNKRELQQIALNHSSDIDFKDFMNIYKKCTKEPYSYNMTLIEKLRKYLLYHQVKLTNMNTLLVKKYHRINSK